MVLALPLVEGKPHEPFLRTKAKNLGIEPEAFILAVQQRMAIGEDPALSALETTEEHYRFEEYKAYLGSRPAQQERHDFDTRGIEIIEYGDLFADHFEKVVLVKKLRETRVLTGFSRIVPPEALTGAPAQLSLTPKPWLPGFSVRGEGIFLQFRRASLERWKKDAEVSTRTSQVALRVAEVNANREMLPRPLSAEMLLVHTFSHLLVRQLAFECGYDSAGLRERLYISSEPDTEMAGVLLYTASGDAEGTLGGLVRQGEPERLLPTIVSAIRNASICSSDPLCIESGGQGLFSLNLAACHACSLLPETSCEEGNLLLDRGVAIGTPDRPELGFFSKFLT